MTKFGLFLDYVFSIIAAAYCIGHVGTAIPHGPHVLPVGFGYTAPSGVFFVGITLLIRDLLQDLGGKRWTVAAVIVGAGLAAFLSPTVAVASGTAFLLSELLDMAVYTPLRRKGLIRAVLASNAVGLVVDSLVFLAIAFGSLMFWQGQVIGKAEATLAAALILWIKERRAVSR